MKKKTKYFFVALALLLCTVLFCACGEKGDNGTKPVFTLDKTSIELVAGGNSEKLTLTILNVDETPEWKSSSPEIATVTASASPNAATVKGVKEGTAVITVTAGEERAVCTVTVKPGAYLELKTESLELNVGTSERIEVDTNVTALKYTSNDTSVATVDESGLVSGVAAGSTSVTISGGNLTVTCMVTVVQPYVVLNESSLQLTVEKDANTFLLKAESNGKVEWSSSDESVATVDENGLVTAVGVGEATITARYASAEATCTVKVKEEILTLTLSESEKTLAPKETFQLIASLNPAQTGENAEIEWIVVEGDNIVFVDQEGNVTSIGAYGTAIVRAVSVKDPDAYADCVIDVPDPYADWLAISDKKSFEAAFKTGNEEKNMYLAGDIDLEGAVYTGNLMGDYRGTFDGRGYEIMNFTADRLFGGIEKNGLIENLAITCTAESAEHNGLFGLVMAGTIRNCRFDVTFNSAGANRSIFGRNSTGTVSNTILLARNPKGIGGLVAGCVQGGGTWKEVYVASYGSMGTNGPVSKTEQQLRSAALYQNWDTEIWNIEDGEIPVHKNGGNIGELKVALDCTEATVHNGDTLSLNAVVTPNKLPAADKAVRWSSSDPAIAAVDENGRVTALKEGKTTITVTSVKESEKFAVCEITVDAATVITLQSDENVFLELDAQAEIRVDVSRGGLIWKSSAPSVVSVDENGRITAVGAGSATVTAISSESSGKSVSVSVTVYPAPAVDIEEAERSMEIGEEYTVTAMVNREDEDLQWTSSNENVAAVDEHGVVTAIAAGSAVIKATSSIDGTVFDTIEITVQPEVTIEMIREMTIQKDIPTELVVNVNRGAVTFISDDESVVTVDENGMMTGLKEGSASITVTSAIDPTKKAECLITVKERAEITVTLDKTSAKLDHGETLLLQVVVNVPGVEWKSSDETVATVKDGLVTAMNKDGTAVITVVSTNDPSKKAECTIQVEYVMPVLEITSPEGTNITLEIGQSFDIAYTVSKGAVGIASSDPAKLQVVGNRVVARAAGTFIITAASVERPEVKAEINVTVNIAPIVSIVDKEMLEQGVKLGEEAQADAETNREGTIVWSSSDESVATVDENGLIKALSLGKTVITATFTADGAEKAVTDTVTIIVYEEQTIGMSIEARSLGLGSTFRLDAQAAGGTVVWTSSNPDVATVDLQGNVTGKTLGKTIITATLEGTDKSTTCLVQVYEKPAGAIEVSTVSQFLAMNGTQSYYLVNDIDLAGTEYKENTFGGAILWKLYGNGYSVKNLTVNISGTDVGFINNMDNGSLITDVNFVNLTIKGNAIHGGFIRFMVGNATVSNCFFDVNMEIRTIRTGVIGFMDGASKVENCIFNVNYKDASTLNPIANENPRAMIGRKGAGSIVNCFVDTAILGAANGKVYAVSSTGGGQELYAQAFKDDETLKKAATYDDSWNQYWNIAEGAYPVLKSIFDKDALAVILERGELNVYLSETSKLNVTVKPTEAPAEERAVKWESSDPEIATVENGIVTGIKEGTATIRATSLQNEEVFDECVVTVLPANEIALDTPAKTELEITETLQLGAAATNGAKVIWTSSDPSIAAVSSAGLVTARAEGSVTIRAASSLNAEVYQEITLTVNPEIVLTVAPENEQPDHEYELDETLKLIATASRGSGTWSSSDESVATVDAEGNVCFLKAGEATILFTSDILASKSAEYALRVMEEVSLSLEGTITELKIGGEKQFGVQINREGVVWESSDEAVATVDETGLVTGVGAGEVTITVRSTIDESKSASITFAVKEIITIGITLSEEQIQLDRDAQISLTATVSNSDLGVVWSSSDETIASVDENGNVKTHGKDGEAVIYATSVEDGGNGKAVAECAVTVKFVPVVFDNVTEDLTLETGDTAELTATVNKGGYVWAVVQGEDVVSVDENGNLVALKAGNAVISVTSDIVYNDVTVATATVNILVEERLTVTITLAPETSLKMGDSFTYEAEWTRGEGVVWSSSDPSVAEIDAVTGAVTPVGFGTTVIKAASATAGYEDRFDTHKLTVAPDVVLNLNVARRSLHVNGNGSSWSLQATLSPMPAEPSASDVVWESSDPSIVSVTGGYQNGVYYGNLKTLKAGTVTITATYEARKEFFAVCEIESFQPAAGVTYNGAIDNINTLKYITNGNWYLANDLDFEGVEITGSYVTGTMVGSLDGKGYSIKNIKTGFRSNEVGFIHMMDGTANLSNVNFVNFEIGGEAAFQFGGLIREVNGNASVKNCYFEGSITARGSANVARIGVIGSKWGNGSIENCIFNVGMGDAALSSDMHANPRAMIARWFNGTVAECVVNRDLLNGAKVYAAGNGDGASDKYTAAFKTEAQLKSVETFNESWSGWVLTENEYPQIRNAWNTFDA